MTLNLIHAFGHSLLSEAKLSPVICLERLVAYKEAYFLHSKVLKILNQQTLHPAVLVGIQVK